MHEFNEFLMKSIKERVFLVSRDFNVPKSTRSGNIGVSVRVLGIVKVHADAP